MKKINLKKALQAMKTWETLCNERLRMKRDANWYGPDRIAKCEAETQAAKEALQEVAAPIAAAIRAAEGRATARTITAESLLMHLECMQKKLNGIPKAAMEGLQVRCDLTAQSFPSAYRYTPESTWFTAEYKNNTWWLLSVSRSRTARSGNGTQLTMPEKTEKAILDSFRTF